MFAVGSESVVKATVDASTHSTRQYAGDSVQGDKVVQNITQRESAVAAIFRLVAANRTFGGQTDQAGRASVEELSGQLAQIDWGKDPVELKRVFRKHIAVIEEESFGDTIRSIMLGYRALASYGFLGTGNASKERKLRLQICKMVIEALDDLPTGNADVTPILADCRARYAAAVGRSQKRLWTVVGVAVGLWILVMLIGLLAAHH
jgi:hypothetical protein